MMCVLRNVLIVGFCAIWVGAQKRCIADGNPADFPACDCISDLSVEAMRVMNQRRYRIGIRDNIDLPPLKIAYDLQATSAIHAHDLFGNHTYNCDVPPIKGFQHIIWSNTSDYWEGCCMTLLTGNECGHSKPYELYPNQAQYPQSRVLVISYPFSDQLENNFTTLEEIVFAFDTHRHHLFMDFFEKPEYNLKYIGATVQEHLIFIYGSEYTDYPICEGYDIDPTTTTTTFGPTVPPITTPTPTTITTQIPCQHVDDPTHFPGCDCIDDLSLDAMKVMNLHREGFGLGPLKIAYDLQATSHILANDYFGDNTYNCNDVPIEGFQYFKWSNTSDYWVGCCLKLLEGRDCVHDKPYELFPNQAVNPQTYALVLKSANATHFSSIEDIIEAFDAQRNDLFMNFFDEYRYSLNYMGATVRDDLIFFYGSEYTDYPECNNGPTTTTTSTKTCQAVDDPTHFPGCDCIDDLSVTAMQIMNQRRYRFGLEPLQIAYDLQATSYIHANDFFGTNTYDCNEAPIKGFQNFKWSDNSDYWEGCCLKLINGRDCVHDKPYQLFPNQTEHTSPYELILTMPLSDFVEANFTTIGDILFAFDTQRNHLFMDFFEKPLYNLKYMGATVKGHLIFFYGSQRTDYPECEGHFILPIPTTTTTLEPPTSSTSSTSTTTTTVSSTTVPASFEGCEDIDELSASAMRVVNELREYNGLQSLTPKYDLVGTSFYHANDLTGGNRYPCQTSLFYESYHWSDNEADDVSWGGACCLELLHKNADSCIHNKVSAIFPSACEAAMITKEAVLTHKLHKVFKTGEEVRDAIYFANDINDPYWRPVMNSEMRYIGATVKGGLISLFVSVYSDYENCENVDISPTGIPTPTEFPPSESCPSEHRQLEAAVIDRMHFFRTQLGAPVYTISKNLYGTAKHHVWDLVENEYSCQLHPYRWSGKPPVEGLWEACCSLFNSESCIKGKPVQIYGGPSGSREEVLIHHEGKNFTTREEVTFAIDQFKRNYSSRFDIIIKEEQKAIGVAVNGKYISMFVSTTGGTAPCDYDKANRDGFMSR